MRPSLRAVLATLAALTVVVTALPAQASFDPLRDRQWGLGQLNVRDAWIAGTQGRGVTIAVIDSGIDLTHGDLSPNVVPGATFLDCGPRSCGDGGWLSGPANRRASASPHGTHVAGTAAAVKDNRIGVVGVAPQARILSIKALDDQGGTATDIARAIRHATDRGARVINLSLGLPSGAGQVLSLTGLLPELRSAIAYASSRGALVVAAAGNSSLPICDVPAFEGGALCVTATDRSELPAYYSNGAVKPDLRSVAAPGGSGLPACGENIVSTLPARFDQANRCRDGVSFGELAGTSMASPHVSGVAALLFAQGRSRAQVLDALLSTARTPGVGRGLFTPVYGYGIVDAGAAVRSPRR